MADPVSLGITVALTAANMALTASRKIEGPRLDDLGFTGGDYGAPLLRIWGMRRVQPTVFFAEDLKEVKRRRKTKGGKYNEYTYYGTWAFALAGHEIIALRRMWFDGHLVYDLSGAGPVTPFDLGAAASIDDYIAVYLGTADQEPDPRIEATTEARHGAGSCPAYRDTAYCVIKDLPLEKFGNRIPQVWAEIVVAGPAAYPFDATEGIGGGNLAFAPDYATLLASSGVSGDYTAIDVAARAMMVAGSASISTQDDSDGHGFLADGTILMSQPASWAVHATPIGTSSSAFLDPVVRSLSGTITNVADADGDDHWLTSFPPYYTYNGEERDSGDEFGFDVWFQTILRDADGSIWIVGSRLDDFTTVLFHRVQGSGEGPDTVTATGLPDTEHAVAFHYADEGTDHFVLGKGGDVFRIDRATGAVLGSNSAVYAGGVTVNAFRAIAPGAKSFWVGFAEYASADLSLVRQLRFDQWHGGSAQDVPTVYDPVNHALLTIDGGDLVRNYLDRVGEGETTLGFIVETVAGVAGIDAGEIDAGDLVQTIPGYSVGAGTGKDWLEPILDIYDSDARPHGFALEFVRRGDASAGTIAHGTFAQPRDDSPLYETPGAGGSDLPAMVTMQFADVAADQQPALANSGPLGEVDSARITKLDMGTLAIDSDTARQLVARWHRRKWFERQPYGLALSMQRAGLEPGDVHALALPDSRSATARLTSMVVGADRTIATEWRRDDPSIAALDGAAGAPYDGREPSTVAVPVQAKGFVLDVPLIEDADAAVPPVVYPLAAPFADGPFPGATVYQRIDGEYSEELASVTSSGAATWGYVAEELPYANPNLWDRGSAITVTLQVGELAGCTEAAANADSSLNRAAIGANGRWEIVQFTVATLIAPRTYMLSGFKRGRRGTEWAAELHAAGDAFVLVDHADPVAMGLSEVGTGVSFKAVTSSRTTGFPFGYTFEGQSLKPYAPVHLRAAKEANGDWTFAWVRRTRVGGAWTGGAAIPLSEVSEAYAITVGDGVDSDTITVPDPDYTWTLADQTTLTGGEVLAGDLAWSVAQISDAVGAGFVATA